MKCVIVTVVSDRSSVLSLRPLVTIVKGSESMYAWHWEGPWGPPDEES